MRASIREPSQATVWWKRAAKALRPGWFAPNVCGVIGFSGLGTSANAYRKEVSAPSHLRHAVRKDLHGVAE
jgi:hypothetical protein